MSETKSSPIKTVCCAYDFSESADLALLQALRIVRRHDARLVLVHVVEPIPLGPYPVLVAAKNELAIQGMARERLETVVEPFRTSGLVVDLRVELGEPGPSLISTMEDEDADLVVIGTRGLTGFQHLLLGSTAEYVVRRSKAPVLTVHPSDEVLTDPIEKVVLPTDLSSDADAAALAFIDLFGDIERPHVTLAYADRTPPYLDPFSHEALEAANEPDSVREEIEEKMSPSVGALRAAGFDVETAVLDGDPVSQITELAESTKADLVVLSTHGRSAVLNALLGRTAQRIVQHAPCPVLTVRPLSRIEAEEE